MCTRRVSMHAFEMREELREGGGERVRERDGERETEQHGYV